MSQFECHLEQPVPRAGNYLFPVPIDTSEQKIGQITFDGVEPTDTISSLDGVASAFRFALKEGDLPIVRIAFEEPGPGLSDWHFKPRETRFDRPSQALLEQISSQFTQMDLSTRVLHIIQFIADHFQYGQRDVALGDDEAAMPALECGLTFGTCVDMHTLAVAALRAIGVEAAYVMGGHVATEKQSSPTGHCWINVRHEGVAHHWDISHHVQYGVKIITPELNPKPGRRFALSIGRGHIFSGQDGEVEFPALSGFQALTGDLKGKKLRTMGQFNG
jgi:Transglutaminase-like superfamily